MPTSSKDVVIRVEGLGKRYFMGQRAPERSLYETLGALVTSSFRKARGPQAGDDDWKPFWALSDVSFEVRRGETVGIVGKNGSGKSTLFKILSRITDPTQGRAELRGRLGSLLEVGTGFHPELTGRDNVFLNGAILGMKRHETARKFDEIVAFSEIEPFIDTPVKWYSSGMYMRLAFAVAAHLEPEIMLVDEVLAVGDAAFQRKCLGKMEDVAQQGRTILFVSHSMGSVQTLCDRAIWLDAGKVVEDGTANSVAESYLKTITKKPTTQTWERPESAPGDENVRFRGASIVGENGQSVDHLTVQTPFDVQVEFWNQRADTQLTLQIVLQNEEGLCVFVSTPTMGAAMRGKRLPAGLFRSTCRVPGNFLNTGLYRIAVQFIKDSNAMLPRIDDAIAFEIHDDVPDQEGPRGKWLGAVRPSLDWKTEQVS